MVEPNKLVDNADWTKVVNAVALGATAAGLGYLILKFYRDFNDSKKDNTWTNLTRKFEGVREFATNAKTDIEESVEESFQTIQENISSKIGEWTEELKDKLLSEDTQEALDTIALLLDNVNQFDMKGKAYNGSFFLLLAIVKKIQNLTEFNSWEESLPHKSDITEEQLNRGKRFGKYALGTYGASRETEKDKIAENMGVNSEDILFTWFKSHHEGLCPRFIVFVDNEEKSIVLAIRGTLSLKDMILDMVCEETPYLDGFTHKGILTGARKVWTEACASVVSALNVNTGYSLAVTGHSLGAGVAVLITLELLIGESKDAIPRGTDVRCIALAPPPVYRASQSIFSKSLPSSVFEKIEIYINNHDCIPRMSLGSLTRLLISMRAVDNLALTAMEQVNILQDSNEELLEKVVDAIQKSKQEEYPFLQHPGKIFYLKKEYYGDHLSYVVLQEESEVFTNRLYLLEDMVKDHRKPSYQEAFNLL